MAATTSAVLSGNKQINELESLNKITGKELMLIDNGEFTMKVTVDSLLGYIAKQINAGTIPDDIFNSCSIIEMNIGEEIPEASRVDGNVYLRTCDIHEAQIYAGIDTTITVSPNMALRIVED